MTPGHENEQHDFLAGGREMGVRMRSHDWAKTRLGDPEGWPQSLRTSVSICLDCRFAILIWWGPELVMLYNDDYAPMLGKRHPAALGAVGAEVWADVWPIVGPMLASVVATGTATESHDLLLLMERNGYLEEAYFTFSYSPIRDESGSVAGVFTPVSETTSRVVGERRLRALRDLAAQASGAESAQQACATAASVLQNCGFDFPFALIYVLEGRAATLAACSNAIAGSEFAPSSVVLSRSHTLIAGDLEGAPSHWPVAEVAKTGVPQLVEGLSDAFGDVQTGGWKDAPNAAYVLPIVLAGEDSPAAVLVAGVNPRRAFDEEHRSFFSLVAAQIGNSISAGIAREQERKRAEERIQSLAQMFNNAPAFICVLAGPQHVFELVNPSYLQLVQHRDLLGRTVREAIPEVEGQGYLELLDQVYSSGRPFHGDALALKLQRKPGDPLETRYVNFVYQPTTGEDGKPSGIFVLGIDVTDHILAQEALRKSEKLSTAGRLAATIAHEINNPLEAITNLLYLVRSQAPDGALQYLDLAEHELERVAQITKQTLAFYKESTAPAWFDLGKTIDSILVFYVRSAESKGLQIITRLEPGCNTWGVEGEIKQVVANLLSNAIDALNGMRGTVRIRVRQTGRHCRLILSDSGQGIEPGIAGKIWQPFFTTKEVVGTGLGLWVTKEILSKHDAEIRIRTRNEGGYRGTMFVVDFPRDRREGSEGVDSRSLAEAAHAQA